jgi:hypothetical protein
LADSTHFRAFLATHSNAQVRSIEGAYNNMYKGV